jgi:hypothetical protein
MEMDLVLALYSIAVLPGSTSPISPQRDSFAITPSPRRMRLQVASLPFPIKILGGKALWPNCSHNRKRKSRPHQRADANVFRRAHDEDRHIDSRSAADRMMSIGGTSGTPHRSRNSDVHAPRLGP